MFSSFFLSKLRELTPFPRDSTHSLRCTTSRPIEGGKEEDSTGWEGRGEGREGR